MKILPTTYIWVKIIYSVTGIIISRRNCEHGWPNMSWIWAARAPFGFWFPVSNHPYQISFLWRYVVNITGCSWTALLSRTAGPLFNEMTHIKKLGNNYYLGGCSQPPLFPILDLLLLQKLSNMFLGLPFYPVLGTLRYYPSPWPSLALGPLTVQILSLLCK